MRRSSWRGITLRCWGWRDRVICYVGITTCGVREISRRMAWWLEWIGVEWIGVEGQGRYKTKEERRGLAQWVDGKGRELEEKRGNLKGLVA